jgi:uncharacterized protein YbcI
MLSFKMGKFKIISSGEKILRILSQITKAKNNRTIFFKMPRNIQKKSGNSINYEKK